MKNGRNKSGHATRFFLRQNEEINSKVSSSALISVGRSLYANVNHNDFGQIIL